MSSSVVKITGQNWKLAAGVAALVVGSLAPLSARSGMSWTVGTILATVGYVFTLVAVRCPACGSRWFWQAAQRVELYKPLFTRPSCPDCKHEFPS